MSPWLAPGRVTREEQRQRVEGRGSPLPFGTFGDTSMAPAAPRGWDGFKGPWVQHVELWVRARGPGWGCTVSKHSGAGFAPAPSVPQEAMQDGLLGFFFNVFI